MSDSVYRIDRSLRLPPNEYLSGRHKKTLIVLHHTAGADAESTFRWWDTDPKRIGTAFIVARNGRIYEVFDPKGWAFHIAVKDKGISKASRRHAEHRSIGIELANAGWLIKRGVEFYKFGRLTRGNRYRGNVYHLDRAWRGQRYFEPYKDAQVRAVAGLVDSLCDEFAIPREMSWSPRTLNPSLANFAHGIISHGNVRPDKTDLHPGFDWKMFARLANLRAVL